MTERDAAWKREIQKRAYHVAANKWIEDEMWNQRERRPLDLHDVAAFCRGFYSAWELIVETGGEVGIPTTK